MPIPVVRSCVEFRNIRYYLDNDGYYKASRSAGRGLLHRAIWAAANGPIPDGWHVHHKDHDRGNNDLANLVAVTPSAHVRAHGVRGAWAVSPEEHGRISREAWEQREPRSYTCLECGAEFTARSQRAAHYCGSKCADRAHGRRRTQRKRERREAGL